MGYFNARPFPTIHEQARLARVPVIMYHDVLPQKTVFFDRTPAELEADFELIRRQGATPIHLDHLVRHLVTGAPLPEKPVLLTFDDGYRGHYDHVYPLLKRYGYPAVFAIYTAKVNRTYGRSSLTWAHLREMARDPLVTIAAHSVTHPSDLGELTGEELRREIVDSKRHLESELGIAINHFVYPEGNYDDAVKHWVALAGYQSALTMRKHDERFASESADLLTIERFGFSQLKTVLEQSYGGPPLPPPGQAVNFGVDLRLQQMTIQDVPLTLIAGGKPVTFLADSRYQVHEIIANTRAIAAVDGAFFSMKYLDSNQMIGPVLSHNTGQFVPDTLDTQGRIQGRPLVLISEDAVRFVPYDAARHNTLAGIRAEQADVTDAFVAAAWLVQEGEAQPASRFGNLFGFDIQRHRAFWGVDYAGRPIIGISERTDAVTLGQILKQAGFYTAVMLDSGASTSMVYQGESLVGFIPRPVPHVVALLPPETDDAAIACAPPCTSQTPCKTLVATRPTLAWER